MNLLRAFIDYCLLPSHNYEEKNVVVKKRWPHIGSLKNN